MSFYSPATEGAQRLETPGDAWGQLKHRRSGALPSKFVLNTILALTYLKLLLTQIWTLFKNLCLSVLSMIPSPKIPITDVIPGPVKVSCSTCVTGSRILVGQGAFYG